MLAGNVFAVTPRARSSSDRARSSARSVIGTRAGLRRRSAGPVRRARARAAANSCRATRSVGAQTRQPRLDRSRRGPPARPRPARPGRRPDPAEDRGRAGRQRGDGPLSSGSRPASTAASTSPIAVSMPLIPLAASPNSTVLVDLGVRRVVGRDRVGGAVDEGRQARGRVGGRAERRIDPERRAYGAAIERAVGPRVAASPSHAQRRAPASHSSVSARWCGVTSQVTGRPAAFARRTRSSAPAVETCVRCRRAPGTSRMTSARIARSRATAASSAAAGQPFRPEHGRDEAVVRLGAVGERRLLGVVDDRQAEHPGVGQRVPEQRPRRNRRPVVARSPRPRRPPARRAPRASPRGVPRTRSRTASARTGEPDAPAAAWTRARTAGSSSAGDVFGMRQTVVNPPWAAAARPEATVSASSLPGSRKWAWRSMNPGATTTPRSSIPSSPRRRRARRRTRARRR